MKKFGYPNTLVKEYNNWCICLRPEQVTLGSLVLICKEEVTAFSEISTGHLKSLHKLLRRPKST